MDRASCEHLEALIKSSQSLVSCETVEEERFRSLLRFACDNLHIIFYEWSIVGGLKRNGQIDEADTNDPIHCLGFIRRYSAPAVFLLKDFVTHLQNPAIVRMFREVVSGFTTTSTIFVCAPEINLSSEIAHLTVPFELALPKEGELNSLLNSIVTTLMSTNKIKVNVTEKEKQSLVAALSGLTLRQARQVITYAIAEDNALTSKDIETVLKRKGDLIQSSGLLEMYPTTGQNLEIGGFNGLKEWLETARVAMSAEAKSLNIPAPKGILLVGIPGCGKSLCAKVIASRWQQPLVRLDASRLFDKYMGETEKNFRKATEVVEAMAPCVFWIDEIEKIMGGASGGEGDGGSGQRAFGMFLTWMQEKKNGVFLIATANDISGLPPELLRKGRFDEIFFVDLPNLSERTEIFRIQLKRHNLKPEAVNASELAQLSEGFSGSEIDQFITSSLLKCLRNHTSISTENLNKEIARFIPLSKSRAQEIENMRAFAKDRFVSVS